MPKGNNQRTIINLADQVPDLKPYLRPDERVIEIKHCPTPSFKELPHYHSELAKLCGVDRVEDIGKNGPPIAARAIEYTEGQGSFECRFGRDGLYAAKDFLLEFPLLTRTVLLDYASLIGMIENLYREEEFGRMFHEAREEMDPIRQDLTHDSGWGWPFYAAVDATPLFVVVLHRYIKMSPEGKSFLDETYTGRDGNIHRMRDALRYSIQWIVSRLNRNPEHFLEYKPAFPTSHWNQVMEDSWDSHFHEDGTMVNLAQGVCSTEVQGLAYDALLMAADLFDDRPQLQGAVSYYRYLAGQVKESFLRHLLIANEQGTYFAPGSDRDEKGRIRILTARKAIPYFVLESRLLRDAGKHSRKIVEECIRTLFGRGLFCAGGLRTLAPDEPRFMPGAYHNGASWPLQTFQVAEGLRNHGYHALAHELDRRVMRIVEETRLYPEHVRGEEGDEIRLNERIVVTYDETCKRDNYRETPPQQIQLWTLTAYGAIKYRETRSKDKTPPTPFEEEILENLSLT